ncbi:MAG: spore coat protein U domain-containing protein [Polaromonas sp.]|nr:spore coat protein U domain-containing protein [Polaromonas sp.]
MVTFSSFCRFVGSRGSRSLLMVAAAALTAGHAWSACAVSSPGVSFGSYQPLTFPGKLTSADVLSTGTVSITCSVIVSLSSYTVALGASSAGTGDRISIRYLSNSNGGADMAFNLYTDANRSIVWGNGTTGSVITGSLPIITVGSQTQTFTVYGKIPAGQNTLKSGSFSGAMTVTLTYNP